MDTDNATLASLAIDPVPEGYQIRLPPPAFTAFLAAFIFFVFLPGIGRIIFRLYVSRRLFIDDYLVLFAILCLAPAAALVQTIYGLIYEQVWTGIGWHEPPPHFFPEMLVFEKRILAASSLTWAALYAIKFAFLVFFKKLVSRVERLLWYWWGVVILTALCGLVSIPLGFIVCPHLEVDYMSWCPITSQLGNEKIYLMITCIFDVVTDFLILIVPFSLLWPLQLALRRKIGLMAMMSLSTLMIVIAIVRFAGAELPNGVVDTAWLVFWSGMEAAVAVLMVSLLMLKSMFSIESERRSERQRRLDAEKGELSGSSQSMPRRSWRWSFRRSRDTSNNDSRSWRWSSRRSQPLSTDDGRSWRWSSHRSHDLSTDDNQVQRYAWNPTQSFADPAMSISYHRGTSWQSEPKYKQVPTTIRELEPEIVRAPPTRVPPRRPLPAASGRTQSSPAVPQVTSPTFLIDRTRTPSWNSISAHPQLMSRYFPDRPTYR